MSRIGKREIYIPKEVTVTTSGNEIEVRGPKGSLKRVISSEIGVHVSQDKFSFSLLSKSRRAKALWGLTRVLVNNMVIGVTKGFEKTLELHGVGYRVELKDNKLIFNVGYSHPLTFQVPEGISVAVKERQIQVKGIDKELVGQVAASIRRIKPPESYKGKGLRYVGEKLRIKPGKGAKTGG
jgi:large subunit ribosomal protein L6